MNSSCMLSLAKGCGTSACLIMAIGAQNAFVLKQGLMKSHVFWVALLCGIIDAILIALGVGGFGQIITCTPYLLEITKYGGAIFLFVYGARSFWSAYKGGANLDTNQVASKPSLAVVILTLLSLSLLNPHVYLDTVILLGSIGAQFDYPERLFFGFGAVTASFIWFFSLSYGAGYLTPLFKKPLAWRILDTLVGGIMWGIAISLVWS